ncbi:peptidase S9 [Luteitalea sp. TBR-22]|uniref:prolyl oligopeptidase family serine peptidase n=1 Tax=Luteitalea sp. TBR-22 TaxID=2802971 RepID=UPI001AFC3028|nr:prolyl oligopeptidase family serine peptidase [Luteitalea sp. TBR-22]BCS31532.1 peptidase S9 [Luteitalea sp. TBR-22]
MTSSRPPLPIAAGLLGTALVVSTLLVPLAAQAPAGPTAAGTATKATFPLTVDSIMRGPALVGYPPSGLRWSGDGARLFFEWQDRGEDETATWVVGADGAGLRRLTDEERKAAPPVNGQWDRARRRVLAASRGDIVLIDTVAGTRTELTRTAGAESSPRWSRDESQVTFVRDGGLFLLPLTGGGLRQLVESGPKAPDRKKTDSQQTLATEEADLLAHVRESKRRRERDEARREKEALPKLELKARQSVTDMQLDPSGRYVWAIVTERPDGARTADVPDYVTESGYVESLSGRAKVGDLQSKAMLVVLDLEARRSTWVTLPAAGGTEKAPRELRWGMPQVSDDGAVAVASVRAADNKDRWLVKVEPATGAATVLDHLHDEAWVREGFGPGSASFGWLPGGHRLWFTSEKTGWQHLYTLDADGPGTPTALTSGPWEVTDVALSTDRRTFFLTTTEVHPGERHLYALPIDGGPRTRLTARTGGHLGEVSPDGRTIGFVFSTGNTPPEVYVGPYGSSAAPVRVTTSPSPEWTTYRWIDPPVITFPARDGQVLHARLYTPEMVGAKRHASRPAVMFVHGAGYLQNAHRYWSTYFREYMFHHLLASRGYVVLDVDYRASAGYGRDFRTGIYRHMGGKDLDDIVDGAKYLVAKEKVDPRRIGVYGGSYGGFITLMAMFTTPDVFAAGAALRPVTDWAHYNHPYTANILNLPQSDAEAYRRSSPIHFADGLKGALLICHGLVDVNVHAQDSIRLAQKLIELRKENWELALYPVEDHGFEEATSWADEYKRILKLFERNLTGR